MDLGMLCGEGNGHTLRGVFFNFPDPSGTVVGFCFVSIARFQLG